MLLVARNPFIYWQEDFCFEFVRNQELYLQGDQFTSMLDPLYSDAGESSLVELLTT